MPLFKRRREEPAQAQPAPDEKETRAGGILVHPPLSPYDLAPGTEVAGYRINGLLGRGGMGVVYRAEHVHLGRPVALKLLAPGLLGDFRKRFVRESRIAASLSHPNIVTVYDAGEHDGTLYIAMQLIRGTDVRKIVKEGPREPAEVVLMTDQVGSALDAAHRAALVHRDVKPANILVDGDHHWLGDFGLTKRLASSTELTAAKDIVGTPDYLSPEQIDGHVLDGRVDQYALACVVHHCLTGTPPFERSSDIAVIQAHLKEPPPHVSEVRPGLPEDVDHVLARAMAKEPAERFPSCTDFAHALRAGLGLVAAGAQPALPAGYVMVAVVDPSTRAVIRAALGRGKLEVAEAEDLDQVVAMVNHARPALVLLDAELPGGSPAEVCRTLRESEGTERLPIVALAERGREEQWREALAGGADDVLLRPFSAFQLLAKIRDHVPQALER